MSSISRFINYIYCWIYCIKNRIKFFQEPNWPFVSFWNLKSLYFICSHSFSFIVPLPVIRCHSFSLVSTRCHLLLLFVTRCHSLSLYLSLVTVRCHSLSFVVTRCTTRCDTTCYLLSARCHSFSLFVPLVLTGCHSMYLSSVFL